MTALPLDDAPAARDKLAAYADVGVTHLVQGTGRVDEAGFRDVVVEPFDPRLEEPTVGRAPVDGAPADRRGALQRRPPR